jgi:hypothetical protein
MLAEGYIRTYKIRKATQLLERQENLILDNIQIASLSCDLYLSNNKVFKCESSVQQLKQRHGEAGYILLPKAKLLKCRKRPKGCLTLTSTLICLFD